MKFFIIGIDDNREQYFTPEVQQVIQSHALFSGGARHYEIVKSYLPGEHLWIPITVPLTDVFIQYGKYDTVVVFASGDPLFYGFANTVLREMPEAEVKVFPSLNSLQLLAHRLLMPYHDMHVVSLTGRPWDKFDEALIRGHEKIGVLTDNKEHTPATIATRMLEYGYDNYSMSVGELLGNGEKEKVSEWRLEEVTGNTFIFPNNLILRRTHVRSRPFGIPEADFHLLNGRARMITKMPIRLLSLSMLDLHNRSVFWDIGFCTGSVSVEAKLQFPHLRIIAFEQRGEGKQLMHDNSRKFGTPGIKAVIGDFIQIDTTSYPNPDAVFIGGHGGKMDEIMEKLSGLLADEGVIVFNSVSEESHQLFLEAITKYNFQLQQTTRIQTDNFNPIDVIKVTR